MSIMEIAKIKQTESDEYRKLVSSIHSQFEDLYKKMQTYAINESLLYLKLAYKCFEKAVAEDLNND